MDKKVFLTVFIAALFALLVAFVFIKNSNNADMPAKESNQVKEEVVAEEDSKEEVVVDFEENLDNQKNEVSSLKSQDVKKDAVQPKGVVKQETPVFDQIVVQEGSVVEEVEPDYGIKKVGDTIEVTREFKVKSPVKYSFKDFGILDKVSTK